MGVELCRHRSRVQGVSRPKRLRCGAGLACHGARPRLAVVDQVSAHLLRLELALRDGPGVPRHGGHLPGRRRAGDRRCHPQSHRDALSSCRRERDAMLGLEWQYLRKPQDLRCQGMGCSIARALSPCARKCPRWNLWCWPAKLSLWFADYHRLQLLQVRPLWSARLEHRFARGAGDPLQALGGSLRHGRYDAADGCRALPRCRTHVSSSQPLRMGLRLHGVVGRIPRGHP
mmetsp:Transcript_28172/g.74785  ORF Transcript_28172/g.74785 Transcript_28172/m.74785 type:complete len:230 (-) Transcript_28172:233-922(-)